MPPQHTHAPAVDPAALAHVLRRQARAGEAPWLHQEVARRMAERLPLMRQSPRTWVDWWGHRGGGAAAVAAVWPRAQRQVVEPTAELAAVSRGGMGGLWWLPGARAAARRRVRLEADPAPEPTQMVWANMMLHASLDVDATFARWHEILEVGGFLMFSTLGPGSLRELREVYAEQGWPSPHLPFVDMHDLGDQLVACGFADPVMDQERIRLGWSSPTALLDELRAIGGHFDGARHAGLRTPRWRARLHRALASRADAQGRIHLSFEIVYGHAFKAAPPSTRQQTATVSLESVRLTLRNRAQGGDGA